VSDLEAAHRLDPINTDISRQLEVLRARLQRLELRPDRMFESILERARVEKEREEDSLRLEEKRLRRETRLRKAC